ncbi:MAG TPA: chemotaxis protein CheZ [Alphaproteobacteria bacterium]|nr:chemotaxis protein CheZ [Alphaproteobacteria bacterium]
MSAKPVDDLLKIENTNRVGLIQQLEELTSYVRKVSRELAAIGPSKLRNSHIPHATDQLGAVVEATELAANQIMDACDSLQTVGMEVGGEHAKKIGDAVTTIYEACGFQDLTGQRIVTVRQTLNVIEGRLGDLMQMLGIPQDLHNDTDGHDDGLTIAENKMLNGPQLPGAAIDQSAIDALLADMS